MCASSCTHSSCFEKYGPTNAQSFSCFFFFLGLSSLMHRCWLRRLRSFAMAAAIPSIVPTTSNCSLSLEHLSACVVGKQVAQAPTNSPHSTSPRDTPLFGAPLHTVFEFLRSVCWVRLCVCVFVWNMSLCFVCDHFSSLPHEEMAREAHGCRRPGGRACEETNRETWDEPQWIVAQGPLSALTIPRFILSRLQKICRFRNLKLQVPAHTL